LSFFDEEEETSVRAPAAEPRRRQRRSGSRPPGGGRRPARGGRRPPDAQAIKIRQGLAVGALLVVIILIVVGVHSCTVSSTNSALRSYSDSVNSLISSSNQNGQRFFSLLSGASGVGNTTTLQSRVEATRIAADHQFQRAQGLSAPGQLTEAQQYLVSTMRLRRDGITNVAKELQTALQTSAAAATAAVDSIATEMARLYASDVLYKDYSLPLIESALTKAGIAVGGVNGEPVNTTQFVPNLQWLTPSFVSGELHATTIPSSSSKPPPPGTPVGHELDSCNVGSTTLSTVGATSLAAGSAPTLTCTVTNDGAVTEKNVVVRAAISGTSSVGQGIIPTTQSGQQYTVQIPLTSAPPAGSYSLKVTVEAVPGEKVLTHNTKVFPVTFG
jgi:hypothetical protein